MKFTYEAYKNLIRKLVEKDYSISDYENFDKYNKCVVLRHDVDYSIDKAFEFAQFENNIGLGIKSTYFLLLTTPFYNIVSKENREKVIAIKELGHDIGLHFDELNYNKDYYKFHGGIKNVIMQEREIMKNILGFEIKAVSMHRPSENTLKADYDLSPAINSYSKIFFNEFKYVSDSRRRWRENVDEIIETGKYDKLHILTHAFWYNEKEEDIKTSIKKFVLTAKYDRYNELDKNITDLSSILREDEINE